jgi:hypothetical protein
VTKIQIIIDEDNSIKVIDCAGITIKHPNPNYSLGYNYDPSDDVFEFEAKNAILDESPNLISMPDALLLRLRNYNIDVEHQRAIKETQELNEKIKSLKDQVYGWELRRDLAIEEWERYHEKIGKIIDRYPRVAAEIALEDGDLDAACYFAEKASEEE